MNNYDYPLGADNKSAPWNQEDSPRKEVEVTICLSISKTVTIEASEDESLEDVVKEINLLPKDIEDWTIDDFEVIKEN